MLVPKDNSVIAGKDSKSVYQITGNDKAYITVLFNASASGKLTPPMILFTLKKPPTWIKEKKEKEQLMQKEFQECQKKI